MRGTSRPQNMVHHCVLNMLYVYRMISAETRDTGCARKARDAEVRAQQRKTRRSSDNVWSIWSAAKSGETERSVSHRFALCVRVGVLPLRLNGLPFLLL